MAPIWEGRLQSFGQVGALVRIPQGPITLLATVTLVGIAELSTPLPPLHVSQVGDRWLQVQLLGEIDGLGRFQRGVTKYPGLDDRVHFATSRELRAIYPEPGIGAVRIGALAATPEVPVCLSVAPMVTRHVAIVGSTGSGKTSAVATLVQRLIEGGWKSANIVIVDPHGEYAPALSSIAAVRSVVSESPIGLLRVPFWALPASECLRALCGPVDSATITSKFSELVTKARREFAEQASWLIDVDKRSINADTPIPFDLRKVWHQFDYDNNSTYTQQHGAGTAEIEEQGDANTLRSTRFKTYGLGSQAPFKGPTFLNYGTAPDRMRRRLADPRFRFFQEPGADAAYAADPLPSVLADWLGGDKAVSVLDFSGVPSEVTDLAVGTILQLLFEVAVRSHSDGIGRPRPVFILLEEAHRYLGSEASVKVAAEAANRIAREGRKYGVGLALISQRPSELPETALAQCGTVVALRLTNGTDQSRVKAALPDAVAGLADALPSLRTGEALVSGEAIALPTRVLFDQPEPEPNASDPSVESWRAPAALNDLAAAVARWRGLDAEEVTQS